MAILSTIDLQKYALRFSLYAVPRNRPKRWERKWMAILINFRMESNYTKHRNIYNLCTYIHTYLMLFMRINRWMLVIWKLNEYLCFTSMEYWSHFSTKKLDCHASASNQSHDINLHSMWYKTKQFCYICIALFS